MGVEDGKEMRGEERREEIKGGEMRGNKIEEV